MQFCFRITPIILLLACNEPNKNPQHTEDRDKNIFAKVSLRQEWFPYAGYAGEVVAAALTDSVYGLEIKLEAGADNIDPIKLVKSGSNDFGVVSADRILTANEKGAELVAIGVINYISPTCFLSKKEKNVKNPKDFEGKTVGILTGTNTEYIYRALVKKTGLDRKKIKEIEIPFDLGTFIAGSYDVRPAFIYDETVSLDMQNIQYSILEPKNYDIHFLGTVYFTTQKMIDENPEIVQSFINAIADGWTIALQKPDQAISYLKKFDSNIDEKREIASLIKGIEYFRGQNGKVLYAETSEWEQMANTLSELGALKNTKIDNCVNYKFIDKYYAKKDANSTK